MKQKLKSAVSLPLLQSKTSQLIFGLSKPSVCLFILLLSTSLIDSKANLIHGSPRDTKDAFSQYSNKVILDWNLAAFDALEAPNYLNTLTASRLTAMVHIAQHDALNSITQVYEKYNTTANDAGAHPIVAASVAAHAVLLYHIPEKKAMLDLQLAKALDTIPNSHAKQKGIEIGMQAGNAILQARKNDGAFQNPVAAVAKPFRKQALDSNK
jgi:hypothetical protein